MLDMSQEQFAKLSGVAVSTIILFEAGQRKPFQSTIEKLIPALETAGVEFIKENGGGAGVRLKKVN